MARSGSEGHRGEKPLSFLPAAPLTSMHTGSHLSEDPGCQHKRKLHLDTNAHLGSPASERRSAPDYVWILRFVSTPLGTRLDKFTVTDLISSRCHWRFHQATSRTCGTATQARVRRNKHGLYYLLTGKKAAALFLFFVLHQKTAVECNVRRGARRCSLSHSPHARQQQ